MKKFLSILIALSLAISSLFAFSINAYANSLKTAAQIMLGQSINATVSNVDDNAKNYWFKFDCLSSNYYDLLTSSQALTNADVFLTVYNADKTVINSNINSNTDLNFNTTTYFEAGKTYYFKYEVSDSSYTFTASLNIHNHNYISTFAKAVADDDRENAIDGYVKYRCSSCGDEYIAQNIFAPVSVSLSSLKVAYNGYEKYNNITVYDKLGNVIPASEYVVTYEDNIRCGKAWVYVNFIGNNYKGELTSSFIIVPAKPTTVSLTAKKNKITFKWNKDTTASGYEIQYSTSKSFSKSKTKSVTVTKNSTKSKTFSKLLKKKKYYVRIRAYKTIDGVKVLDDISFVVGREDKIAFVGSNGLAKTTLFQILAGQMEPDEGSYKWGITTSQSYFPKDNTKDFDSDDAIVDWLTQYSDNKDATYVRQFLGRMLFPGDAGVKKVRVLSGGEKVRVMLSKLMISGANVLIVDEPTDHLDMESITALNNGLIKFPGVLLFSSRDHQVVQTTANRIMEIVNGKLIDKITTYDEYLENDEMARKRAVYTTDGMDADN